MKMERTICRRTSSIHDFLFNYAYQKLDGAMGEGLENLSKKSSVSAQRMKRKNKIARLNG